MSLDLQTYKQMTNLNYKLEQQLQKLMHFQLKHTLSVHCNTNTYRTESFLLLKLFPSILHSLLLLWIQMAASSHSQQSCTTAPCWCYFPGSPKKLLLSFFFHVNTIFILFKDKNLTNLLLLNYTEHVYIANS